MGLEIFFTYEFRRAMDIDPGSSVERFRQSSTNKPTGKSRPTFRPRIRTTLMAFVFSFRVFQPEGFCEDLKSARGREETPLLGKTNR
jgi:hypothetical protein